MDVSRLRARTAAGTAVGAACLAAAVRMARYGRWRPWFLTWGAMTSEARATLPGDDLLADPDIVTTRVISIDAPARLVWPWLVQMGPGRAGAYSYDWVENVLGLGMHSADAIIPEFQHIAPGDTVQLGSRGPVLRVAVVQPERALVVAADDGTWVWAFVLDPRAGATRLISRNRIATPGARWPARAIMRYVMEPGSLVMERKMLLGIKARAERLAAAGALAAMNVSLLLRWQ